MAKARLNEKYSKDVVPALTKEFNYKNWMQVPKLTKIVVNMGLGEVVQNPKSLDVAVRDMTAIVGQKVMVTVTEVDLPRNRIALSMRSNPQLGPKTPGASSGSPRAPVSHAGPRAAASAPRAPQAVNNDWFTAALNKKR